MSCVYFNKGDRVKVVGKSNNFLLGTTGTIIDEYSTNDHELYVVIEPDFGVVGGVKFDNVEIIQELDLDEVIEKEATDETIELFTSEEIQDDEEEEAV